MAAMQHPSHSNGCSVSRYTKICIHSNAVWCRPGTASLSKWASLPEHAFLGHSISLQDMQPHDQLCKYWWCWKLTSGHRCHTSCRRGPSDLHSIQYVIDQNQQCDVAISGSAAALSMIRCGATSARQSKDVHWHIAGDCTGPERHTISHKCILSKHALSKRH